MELLGKIFPAILDTKNGNRAQNNVFQKGTKNKITHFNIAVAAWRYNIV